MIRKHCFGNVNILNKFERFRNNLKRRQRPGLNAYRQPPTANHQPPITNHQPATDCRHFVGHCILKILKKNSSDKKHYFVLQIQWKRQYFK